MKQSRLFVKEKSERKKRDPNHPSRGQISAFIMTINGKEAAYRLAHETEFSLATGCADSRCKLRAAVF